MNASSQPIEMQGVNIKHDIPVNKIYYFLHLDHRMGLKIKYGIPLLTAHIGSKSPWDAAGLVPAGQGQTRYLPYQIIEA